MNISNLALPNKLTSEHSVESTPFTYKHKVYFNETNAVGGVAYFSNFVKWQGMAREEYFISTVPEWREIMKQIESGKVNMVTAEEHSHFIQHAYFGDELLIELFTANIRRFSFSMLFFIYNMKTLDLLYEGIQKLAFDNFHGKFVEIPKSMLVSVKRNIIKNSEISDSRLIKYI